MCEGRKKSLNAAGMEINMQAAGQGSTVERARLSIQTAWSRVLGGWPVWWLRPQAKGSVAQATGVAAQLTRAQGHTVHNQTMHTTVLRFGRSE